MKLFRYSFFFLFWTFSLFLFGIVLLGMWFYSAGASCKTYSFSVLFVHTHHQTNLIYYYVGFCFTSISSAAWVIPFFILYIVPIFRGLGHHMVFFYGFQVFFLENSFVFKIFVLFPVSSFDIYCIDTALVQFSFFSLDILARTLDSI